MHRAKQSAEPSRPPSPAAPPTAPWLAGAAIGMTLLGLASGAMAMGAGWALSGFGGKKG
ncbi:MAG: hypothetical protein J0H67_17550 [Rhodospirillales bacterium]|nr:hypothetical protein [Rhodospirillales bacterium]MBN8898555.1 hypothetical protein [Rhodospirillales bacterium]MBN8903989.1 hypothetical protein [Rhodospirillales bacterium]MBN8909905.1 hypothetical protein [Rhodospirillales bacterium]